MRINSAFVSRALALVLLAAAAASAQTPEAGGVPAGPWTGSFQVGARGTSVTGDAARYERYRDLSDGAVLDDVRLFRERNNWFLNLTANHVGYQDQRYLANAERAGTFKGWFLWDQIPMTLSTSTKTFFSGIDSNTLRISDPIQVAGQASAAAISPLFNQLGVVFETQTRRRIAEGGFRYEATPDLSFNAILRNTHREGVIPYGGSFGHSSLVEMPTPTFHTTTTADAGAEFVRDRVTLRAGYTGSFFQNDFTSVVFDNPFRAIDAPSTPSAGRLTLAPSNSFMGVNGLATVRLPARSRATAYVSTGWLTDAGDPIVPQTVNTSVVTAPLPRTTVDGEARTAALKFTFVSRPNPYVDVNVAYRQYEYDNRTPEFAMTERVSYDNTVSVVNPPVLTEPFGLVRHTFDADYKVSPRRGVSAGIGFSRLEEDRTHRIYETISDNVLRVTADAVSNRWFTLRTKYEYAERRGTGIEKGETELAAIGEQPGMRHFDIAPRDRSRITVLGAVTPVNNLGLSLSVAAGKDDYLQSEFGVRDNTHRIYGFGFDATPIDRVILAASYSYENYNALSRSRQANPGVQFTDPSRNWATDATDFAHTVMLNAEVLRIAQKVDLRLTYDFSRARGRYDYITGAVPDRTLPEEVIVPSTLPPPLALPPTFSELNRGTLDLTYPLGRHLSVGGSYWYEQYRVEDFTLDEENNQQLARGQTLLLGYLYRPYSANTVWGRLIYHW